MTNKREWIFLEFFKGRYYLFCIFNIKKFLEGNNNRQ